MDLRLHTFDLPLKHRFTISRGSVDVQSTFIVELEQDGRHGFGEATSNDYYGQTIEHLQSVLESLRQDLAALELSEARDPEAVWDHLHQDARLASEPFAHCALDQALWDLWGKLNDQPVWKLWGLDPQTAPSSNFTIGIDEPDVMVAKLQEEPGWPCYKIKLGTDHDVELVRRLREATDAVFRVDANCGWQPDQVVELARALKELNVEFIEQPLPADQWDAMSHIYQECPLPLAADESCQQPDDVARCQNHFHIVNIKLVKCGGLTPARRMIEQARKLGLQSMVGCMTESTIGIAAIAQLLPMLDYVDMDGANLLAKDIASGPQVIQGHCQFNDSPGAGVALL